MTTALELGEKFVTERNRLTPFYDELAEKLKVTFEVIRDFYAKTGNTNGTYSWVRSRHYASFLTDDVYLDGIDFIDDHDNYYITFAEIDNILGYLEDEEAKRQVVLTQLRKNTENVLAIRKAALLEELANIDKQLKV